MLFRPPIQSLHERYIISKLQLPTMVCIHSKSGTAIEKPVIVACLNTITCLEHNYAKCYTYCVIGRVFMPL
jgi:hypothetical protein